MILIADSGSTKTSWSLFDPENGTTAKCQTSGINPMYQDEKSIYHVLEKEFTLTPHPDGVVPPRRGGGIKLYFYGAGCINKGVNETVQKALAAFFKGSVISVGTDLLGAARSLCQNHEGIACILGTGSNSCYYDGKEIVRNISPLGYMLGDEGSGAVIGRKFIADLLKNQLPDAMHKRFFEKYDLTPHAIMDNVYKKPFPNRFLAQFTLFIHDNLNEPVLRNLVKSSFIEFFRRNVGQYPEASRLPIQFTGGIAFYFKEVLEEAAGESGYITGHINPAPMEGLITYHMNKSI